MIFEELNTSVKSGHDDNDVLNATSPVSPTSSLLNDMTQPPSSTLTTSSISNVKDVTNELEPFNTTEEMQERIINNRESLLRAFAADKNEINSPIVNDVISSSAQDVNLTELISKPSANNAPKSSEKLTWKDESDIKNECVSLDRDLPKPSIDGPPPILHIPSVDVMEQTPPIFNATESNNILLKTVFGLDSKKGIGSEKNVNASEFAPNTGVRSNRIKVKRKNISSSNSLLSDLHLLQGVHVHKGAIWAMKFSHCGMYLCTGGEDGLVIVWSIGPLHLVNQYRQRIDSFSSTSSQVNTGRASFSSNNPGTFVNKNGSYNENRSRKSSYGGDDLAAEGLNEKISSSLLESTNAKPSEVPSSACGSNKLPLELSDFLQYKDVESIPSCAESKSTDDNFLISGGNVGVTEHKPADIKEVPPLSSIGANKQIQYQFKYTDFDFIQKTPFRIFTGHDKDVVDISWSKSQFILSASTDKTVRLWHISKPEMLLKFVHPDILTSVEFHPDQDRFFITGCFDRRIRVWDIIPEGAVREWAQTPDIITAVSITPDGKQVAGGLINGQVYFYEYEGMKYITQMDCHNSRGHYSAGNKVTSVQFISMNSSSKAVADSTPDIRRFSSNRGSESIKSPASLHNPLSAANSAILSPLMSSIIPTSTFNKMLVTTNDSRIRLYDTDDYSLSQKFKAYTYRNTSMQIKASFSDNRKYIISGSDDGKTYVWSCSNETLNKSAFSFTSLFSKLIPNIRLPSRRSETESINATRGKGQQHKQIFKNNSYEYFSGNRAYFKMKNTEISNAASGNLTSTSSGTNPVVNDSNPKDTAVNRVVAIPTTVSMFAPSKSLETIIRKHPRINDTIHSHKNAINKIPQVYNVEFESYVTNIDVDDLCTRIIVTADCEGRIFVIVRGIKF